jgi:hypothetical protein
VSKVCAANKGNAEPCSLPALTESSYCWAHAPENAEKRRKTASKGGRSKPPATEIKDIKATIRGYMRDVEAGKLHRGTASVLSQLAGILLRAVEQERKIKETEQLAEELEDLRRIVEAQSHVGEGQAEVGYVWRR